MIESLAHTFNVTNFDVMILWVMIFGTLALYYFVAINKVFEAAFGATLGIGIYILLSILLLGNPPMGTEGGLFPFGFAVFIISLAVYLIFILAILFPIHGWLVISAPTQPVLYTLLYIWLSLFLFFSLWASLIYMIEQSYVFRVWNIFTWFRSFPYYQEVVKVSWYYGYVMSHQNIIIPLWIILMLYKLLLSNIVTAALLSVWYNLSHVGFYKQKDDTSYRVEFHEVGGGHWWDAHGWHGDAHEHDDHATGGHDAHGWGHH